MVSMYSTKYKPDLAHIWRTKVCVCAKNCEKIQEGSITKTIENKRIYKDIIKRKKKKGQLRTRRPGVRIPHGVPRGRKVCFAATYFLYLRQKRRLRSRWRLCCLTDAASPLRGHPPAPSLAPSFQLRPAALSSPLVCRPAGGHFAETKISILTVPSNSSQASYRLRRAFSFHCKAHRAPFYEPFQ